MQPVEDMNDLDLSEAFAKEDQSTSSRELLLQFARLPLNGSMTFEVPAGMGDIVVSRMRVRWSKLRYVARLRGRSLRPYKMVKQAIMTDGGKDYVTLIKADRIASRVFQDCQLLDAFAQAERTAEGKE